jgi:hypothetical protein
VSAVSSSAHFWGLVNVSVSDLNLLQIKTLGVSVGRDIGQQIQEGAGGLLGPENLVTRSLVLLGHSVSTDTTSVLGYGNSSLVLQHILQVALSLGQLHTVDSMGNFTAVLVMNTKVAATGLGSLFLLVGSFATKRQMLANTTASASQGQCQHYSKVK